MNIYHKFSSKNFDMRINYSKPISYIILHYTELNFEESVSILCSSESKVSSHYVINKDGKTYQLVGDIYRAWHAGQSSWKGEEALNNSSIGIELVNSGKEEFAKDQYESLISLCRSLSYKYNIPRENFLAHSDIAPSRKIDPGVYFNWYYIAQKGFGVNFKKPNKILNFTKYNKEEIIEIKNKLSRFGYKISAIPNEDKEFSDVIRAFLMHFNPWSAAKQAGIDRIFDLSTLYQLDLESKYILDYVSENYSF
jgi:N-acetylmuramoyl-L-alanine amidase